jgi:hypothetical protein
MLKEIKVKANLHLGHVIRITFNHPTGEVRFNQSKKLLWEVGYPSFNLLSFYTMIEPFDQIPIRTENGVLYGCVLSYSKDLGYVFITFHSDPNILYNLAKLTLETRMDVLEKIKEIRSTEKPDLDFYVFTSHFYNKCYCGAVLDPDIHKRCVECTGYKCSCGKCHCTEGRNFKKMY